MSEDYSANIVSLEDEDGNEQEYEHIDTVEIDGETYVALVPVDENADEDADGELIILKITEGDDGEETLYSIEDEAEYKKVVAEFEQRLSEEFEIKED